MTRAEILIKWAKMKRFGCNESRVWIGDKSLATSWRTCPKGSWMGWWLYELRKNETRHDTLRKLAQRYGIYGYPAMHGTDEQEQRFATALRSRYNCDGSRRKRSR